MREKGVVSGGWTDIYSTSSSFFFFSRSLKTWNFFVKFDVQGARSSIYRNVGQFLADYMASHSKILFVRRYFNGFITDTGKFETVTSFTSMVGIRKTPTTLYLFLIRQIL